LSSIPFPKTFPSIFLQQSTHSRVTHSIPCKWNMGWCFVDYSLSSSSLSFVFWLNGIYYLLLFIISQ
jgi:hypothetical protein